MKKLFMFLAVAALTASCTMTKHSVKAVDVQNPIVTTTVASLEVESTPISYEYVPTREDRKALSFKELLGNAQYLALKEHKKGDVLVQVSYSVTAKRILGAMKVKKILVTGYPAKYKNFRTPTKEDRENIETFYGVDTKVIEPAPAGILPIKKMK